MTCNVCPNPTLCTDRCQAYAAELAACEASGQMTAQEVSAHVEAGEMPTPKSCERIEIGFVNFPAADGEEYDEPEVQPYLAVLERLQERLVPFTNSKGVTLKLFVEVAPKGEAGEMEAAKGDERGQHS